jgi:hypothetical protein
VLLIDDVDTGLKVVVPSKKLHRRFHLIKAELSPSRIRQTANSL